MGKIKNIFLMLISCVFGFFSKVFGQDTDSRTDRDVGDISLTNISDTTGASPLAHDVLDLVEMFGPIILSPILSISGIVVFLKKVAKKDPPMKKWQKILISLAIFIIGLVVGWFFFRRVLSHLHSAWHRLGN